LEVGSLGAAWEWAAWEYTGRLVDWLTVWLIRVGGYVLQDEETKKGKQQI